MTIQSLSTEAPGPGIALGELGSAAIAALTDGMVERLIGFAETMVTNLATEEIAELARETERAMYDAVDRCAASNSAPTSLWGLFRELSKPENLKMINLLMTFGKCMCERPSVMSRQQK